MNCERCNKKLSRKTARLIDGKMLCSECMFRPSVVKTGTGHRGYISNPRLYSTVERKIPGMRGHRNYLDLGDALTRRSGLLRTEPVFPVSALREPAAIARGGSHD